jgi:mannose-6-phosphate isomerase
LETRNDPVAEWTTRLCREYPEDLGALAPLYLNLICLNPGEAIYLPPGVLHSYLRGTGIEIMANSDNVIRGGITTKHINIKELLEIVRFDEMDHNILNAVPTREYESSYLTPVREFSLSVINIKGEGEYISETNRSIEIILTIRGSGIIMAKDTTGIELNQGLSVMIPASVDEYRITGNLTAYKASVPNR